MNRQAIAEVQAVHAYPSVSILLPTHRTAPANEEDPIRLKNLTREAHRRLLEEFEERDISSLWERLEALTEEIDHNYNLDGLAIFVNADIGRWYRLPFEVEERVIIDETFATRDLLFALNRTPRYRVLVLSEQPTRLFEGTYGQLQEVREHGFPMEHEGPGGASRLPGGHGVDPSKYRDDAARHFFQDVDSRLHELQNAENLPVVLVGVERHIAFFEEVTEHANAIIGSVHGSHDETPGHELAELTWPVVKAWLERRRDAVIETLEEAVGAGKSASGVVQVWHAAFKGRIATLIVEEDYEVPGVTDETGLQLTPTEDSTQPGIIDDAVDEIVEATLQRHGDVWFAAEGKLARHDRIAAILRY